MIVGKLLCTHGANVRTETLKYSSYGAAQQMISMASDHAKYLHFLDFLPPKGDKGGPQPHIPGLFSTADKIARQRCR